MRIAVGSLNLNDTVSNFNNGHIKGTAAQVVYHDILLFFIVQTICQCSCGRLVDNTFYFQTCNFTCILGGLALCVIKICGNGNHSLIYLFSQIALRICLQLLQNHSGDLLGRILFPINVASIVRAHISLNRSYCFLRIGHCLTLCRFSHKPLTCLSESHHRRRCPCSLSICDYGGFTPLHNSHTAICCTKVNTDNFTHFCILLNYSLQHILY